MDGKETLKIPPGTQTHRILKLKGRGLPNLRGYGSGDQLVRVIIETPTRLTARQKELLKEFEELSGDDHRPLARNFFEKIKEVFGQE